MSWSCVGAFRRLTLFFGKTSRCMGLSSAVVYSRTWKYFHGRMPILANHSIGVS